MEESKVHKIGRTNGKQSEHQTITSTDFASISRSRINDFMRRMTNSSVFSSKNKIYGNAFVRLVLFAFTTHRNRAIHNTTFSFKSDFHDSSSTIFNLWNDLIICVTLRKNQP